MQIGMIGLGRMRASMVTRPLRRQRRCVVHDRQPQGIAGLDCGYCLMVGGEEAVVHRLKPVFTTLASGVGSADQGWLHCGPHGAGHFVKMVHNGTEYGLMAAYAEGFDVLHHASIGQDGGVANTETTPIQVAANAYLESGLQGVRRMPHAHALKAAPTHRHDYRAHYVAELDQGIDLDAICGAGLRLGVDPMGGAGVHDWGAIAERWRLDLTLVSEVVDPSFRFMPLDWDGQIRMDPSSPYAMQRLVALKDRFDIAFACDTDHDRHGIVRPTQGLLRPNHDLCAAIDHLFRHRPPWGAQAAIGKTVVSTQLIDRVAARPSGTEAIYKIYAESFRNGEHLQTLLQEAQAIVDGVIGPA